jgi:transposase
LRDGWDQALPIQRRPRLPQRHSPIARLLSNRARHRLSRTGNRELTAALHRIALTRARCHPEARALIARPRANGDGGLAALRVLKRRLSDVVYRALTGDAHVISTTAT